MPAPYFKISALHIGMLGLLFSLCAINPCQAENSGETDKTLQSAARKPTGQKNIEYAKLALKPLVRRANAGDIKAQFELGSRLNYGRDMPKNTKEALRWLRRAAERGQREAQSLLALKFYNGFDVPPDLTEAFKWTQRLAESGDVAAQSMLANMYANGEGGERNLVRAHMWYNIAAASIGKEDTSDKAAMAAQSAVESRDKIAALLLPDQELEAQRLASDWWLQKQGVGLDEKELLPANRKSSARKASVAPAKPVNNQE